MKSTTMGAMPLKHGNINVVRRSAGRRANRLQPTVWCGLLFLVAIGSLLLIGCGSFPSACDADAVGGDCDNDGVLNGADAFDNDACASVDTDGDGQPDSLILPDSVADDACTTASSLTEDVNDDDDNANDDVDVDDDGNGLIEVRTLEELNSIRFNLAGTGFVAGAGVDANVMGCGGTGGITVCSGYELVNDLDFDTNNDGSIGLNDDALSWGGGNGWLPIGDNSTDSDATRFTAIFDGNGHTISNLLIARDTAYIGLFGYIGAGSEVRRLGLMNARVSYSGTSNAGIGSVAGRSEGAIMAVSATGGSATGNGADSIGGLVGSTTGGSIIASYATGMVNGGDGTDTVGGLVGTNSGPIIASYATGMVNGGGGADIIGGLVGSNVFGTTIMTSYTTSAVNGNAGDDIIGGLVGVEYLRHHDRGQLCRRHGQWRRWRERPGRQAFGDTCYLQHHAHGQLWTWHDNECRHCRH